MVEFLTRIEFVVGASGIHVHTSHCGGALRAFALAELRSASSTTRRIVDVVVPDAAVPRDTLRLPMWMQAHDIDIGAGVAMQRAGATPCSHLVVVQLAGAFECDAHSDSDAVLECMCRQLPGVSIRRDTVFALNVRGCTCVFAVHRADDDEASVVRTVNRSTALSLRAPHELPAVHAQHVGALRLYADELLVAVESRLALTVVPPALRSCGIVLVSGARGSGKSAVLALLRDALDRRRSRVRSFNGVDCAGRSEDALYREFVAPSATAAVIVIVDDLFADADAPVWRALARASSSQQSQWCAVVASTQFSVPRELIGATVALRTPMIDAVLGDSLPALTRGLPPATARRAVARASDQLRRQRDDRGRGGHDLISAVRRAALLADAAADASSDAVTAPLESLDTVPGYAELKMQLRELLVWPLQHRDAMDRLGVTPARGVLLEGPSGCGKTLLATALLRSVPFAVFAVKASDLLSRYLGGTERAIRELFARARRAAPSVVWIDEIDVLAARREHESGDGGGGDDALSRRTLSALLAELDGVGERDGVVILAATSRLAHIDAALLRPGRFDRVLRVGLPSHGDRAAIVAHYASRAPASRLGADDIERVAAQTGGWSCAELAALHREAAFAALRDARDDLRGVTLEAKHFFTLDARAV
jgi:AAA+ superfamily predicted ATPase/energy-coupling factor transporter ATP-binding protein EcfA2